MLQQENSDNLQIFTDINPHDPDDDLCNFEVSDTPRDFFGKVLRDSVPIVIIDDREDDLIDSLAISMKSKRAPENL